MKDKRIIRKNLLDAFIADAVFASLLFILVVFIRNKFKQYIVAIMAYADQVSQLSSILESQKDLALQQLQYLSGSIDPIMLKLKLIIYLVAPLGIYLIWSITQSVHYNLYFRKKFYDIKQVGRFFLVNLPFFAFIMLLLELMFRQLSFGDSFAFNVVFLIIGALAIVLSMYYMQILYIEMYRMNIKEAIKKSFGISFARITKLFPRVFLSMAIFLAWIIMLIDLVIKHVTIKASYTISLVLLMGILLGWSAYKLYLIKHIDRIL